MKLQTAFLALSLLTLPVSAVVACDAPETPSVPDGAGASLEEMIAAQTAVKTFQASNAEYLTCVDEQMGDFKAANPD
jgi:hypothetical protein